MKGPVQAADLGCWRALVERHAADLRAARLLREDMFVDNSWVPADSARGEELSVLLTIEQSLGFGVVGVSTGAISCEGAPFGGMTQSAIEREDSHRGMAEFLELKYLCMDGVG